MQQSKIYLFNPNHDLALANFDENYMPAANVRQLATDLSLLPAWYAGRDNLVLAPSAYNKTFLSCLKERIPHLPELITEAELNSSDFSFSPWGWNPTIRKKLALLTGKPEHLPTRRELELIRKYSNRLVAVELLRKLNPGSGYCGKSFYLTAKEELQTFVLNHEHCILKAPLSGSGKGLNWCKGEFTYHIEHWCDNILKQQGGVVAEPLYNKVEDFAMQFQVHRNGEVCFCGYSLFQTNISGAYVGNVMASDAYIEEKLATYVPIENLRQLKTQIARELTGVYTDVYSGYLGVDMMICSFPEESYYRIHPCVEINLRMTMGMVARTLYDNYIEPGQTGMYRVDYYASPEELKRETLKLQEAFPAVYSNGRMVKGYFPLVPVTPVSRYHAWVNIALPHSHCHTCLLP